MTGARLAAGVRDNSITALLAQLSEGNREVEACLIPPICEELHRLAGHYPRLEGVNYTLQPKAHVDEAYIRLVQQSSIPRRGRVEHQVSLDEDILPTHHESIDVFALDETLGHLTNFDPRHGHLVEFSERTAKRNWSMARTWLKRELSWQP
jgi:hypothetical protein